MKNERDPTVLCPACSSVLECWDDARQGTIVCAGCKLTYHHYAGVLDVRGERQATCWSSALTSEEQLVREMVTAFPTASTADLVQLYVRAHRLPQDVIDRDRDYMLAAHDRERWTVRYMKFCLERYAGPPALAGMALDAGCGSGGSLAHLANRYAHVAGVDPDIGALIVAAKRSHELGVRERVTLVAGTLEQRIFTDGSFAAAKCTDVLEHVVDPARCSERMMRAMRPGGALFVLTPNKFSFAGPEPHVRLWGVQFMPRGMADDYVRKRLGVAYSDIARLLSSRSLGHALRASGAEVIPIPIEDKHLNPHSARGVRIRWILRRAPFRTLSRAVRFFQPSLEAVCLAAPAARASSRQGESTS